MIRCSAAVSTEGGHAPEEEMSTESLTESASGDSDGRQNGVRVDPLDPTAKWYYKTADGWVEFEKGLVLSIEVLFKTQTQSHDELDSRLMLSVCQEWQ